MTMKPLMIMEGSNNESECAGIPEQSQGIVHNFVGESCMYALLILWLLTKFVFVRQVLMHL